MIKRVRCPMCNYKITDCKELVAVFAYKCENTAKCGVSFWIFKETKK
jgi:hypothetical protein